MENVMICSTTKHGWYISQMIGIHTRYLHSDGLWRPSTEPIITGYFTTQEAAVQVAEKAGYPIDNFTPHAPAATVHENARQ